MTGSRPERSALYMQSTLRNDAMTGFFFCPELSVLPYSAVQVEAPCSKALCNLFLNHSAVPMGHGVWPRQPTWAVSTTLVRQRRGNANRGETYPPAVHADARHCAEPAATAPAMRRSLSRFCPPPSVSDQRCSEDRRRQRCGPWCDPSLALGLRCGTAQFSGAPLRRF